MSRERNGEIVRPTFGIMRGRWFRVVEFVFEVLFVLALVLEAGVVPKSARRIRDLRHLVREGRQQQRNEAMPEGVSGERKSG